MGGGGSSKSGEEDGAKSCGRPIQCDVCNMRFSNGANMRRHRMRHSGKYVTETNRTNVMALFNK